MRTKGRIHHSPEEQLKSEASKLPPNDRFALTSHAVEYTTQLVKLPEASASLAAFTFHLPLIGDIAPFKELSVKGLAAAVILVLTIVNYLGVRFGGVVQNVFSIAKMGAMVGLAIAVLITPGVGHVVNLTTGSANPGVYYIPTGTTMPLTLKDNWQSGTGNGSGSVRGNPMWIAVDAARDRIFVSVANSDPAIGGIWRGFRVKF